MIIDIYLIEKDTVVNWPPDTLKKALKYLAQRMCEKVQLVYQDGRCLQFTPKKEGGLHVQLL